MQKDVVLIGSKGRMNQALQKILTEEKRSYRTHLREGPEVDFQGALGVVDFSSPEAQKTALAKACAAGIPYVCGTTGFATDPEKIFAVAAKEIPVVWDSNFSVGIELLAQALETIARALKVPAYLTDLHHRHKKDSPSGTALKLAKRIEAASGIPCDIQSVRAGEIIGEHRAVFAFGEETLELNHRAESRAIFARGALRALSWAAHQKPGFYSMKDVLK